MKVLGVLMISVLLGACQQRVKVTEEKDNVAVEIPVAEQTCYTYIKGKDTAALMLITTGIVSTGELQYKWFEKDKNIGVIEGEMHGDTLIANYSFNSEGRRSVRQVVLLKKVNQFLEGFGEMEEKDGAIKFKDLRKIDFSNPIVFEKVACK